VPSLQQVVNLLAAPPFGIVSRDPGALVLVAGLTSCYRIRGPINVDAVGISFHFTTIPAAFGRKVGLVNEYEERILHFAPVYHSLSSAADPGGHDFYAGFTDVYHEGEYYFFPQLLPSRVDCFVTTGCVVTIDWLLAL